VWAPDRNQRTPTTSPDATDFNAANIALRSIVAADVLVDGTIWPIGNVASTSWPRQTVFQKQIRSLVHDRRTHQRADQRRIYRAPPIPRR